jgi:hypothetical protein
MAKIVLRSISPYDHVAVSKFADFVHEHSWGTDYPLRAEKVLLGSDYIVNAFADSGDRETLVGGAAITHFMGYPSEPDREEMCLCCAVVHPDLYRQGIYTRLYNDRMAVVPKFRRKGERWLYATIDSPEKRKIFVSREPWFKRTFGLGWNKYVDVKNEDGSDAILMGKRIAWL